MVSFLTIYIAFSIYSLPNNDHTDHLTYVLRCSVSF